MYFIVKKNEKNISNQLSDWLEEKKIAVYRLTEKE